eukprot:GFKZ01012037.1.p1 GENE.GFKZ01012037.1~~GFKZ01012037.1.p1  ORF type:complete len:847 (+),score=107.59 GFKZ01012037.1:68-2608(+)
MLQQSTIPQLFHHLAGGSVSDAYEVVIDLDGSHRLANITPQLPPNYPKEAILIDLYLAGRHSDAHRLANLLNHPQIDDAVLQVFAVAAHINPPNLPSPTTVFSTPYLPPRPASLPPATSYPFLTDPHLTTTTESVPSSPLSDHDLGAFDKCVLDRTVGVSQTRVTSVDTVLPISAIAHPHTAPPSPAGETHEPHTRPQPEPNHLLSPAHLFTVGSSEISSALYIAQVHGNAYTKLNQYTERFRNAHNNAAAALLHRWVSDSVRDYLRALRPAERFVPRNAPIGLLCESEGCVEEMLHQIDMLERLGVQGDVIGLKRLDDTAWSYYAPRAAHELGYMVSSMCFHDVQSMISFNLHGVGREQIPLEYQRLHDFQPASEQTRADMLPSVFARGADVLFARARYCTTLFRDTSGGLVDGSELAGVLGFGHTPRNSSFGDSMSGGSSGASDARLGDEVGHDLKYFRLKEMSEESGCGMDAGDGEDKRGLGEYRSSSVLWRERSFSERGDRDGFGEFMSLGVRRRLSALEEFVEGVERRVCDAYLSENKLLEHYKVLLKLALLWDGEFAETLVSQIQAAAEVFERNERFIHARTEAGLTFYGASSMGGTGFRRDEYLQKCLKFALNSSGIVSVEGTEIGLSCVSGGLGGDLWAGRFELRYVPKFCVREVVDGECMRMYSVLFDLFVRVRQARRNVHDIFVRFRRGFPRYDRGWGGGLEGSCRVWAKLWQFCWNANFFVSVVSENTMEVVLRDKWCEDLLKGMCVDNLEEVCREHREFLMRSERSCFLGEKNGKVIGVLMGGLQTIFNVKKDLMRKMELDVGMQSIGDMLSGATASLKRRYAFFQDVCERCSD